MADDDHSGTKPAPVVLRIKLRYDDIETFVERFAANIGKAGLFVHSKTPRPVATEVKFELRLADDKPILVGIGTVRESRVPDPARPREPSGMMIAFTRVTRDSRDLLLRVLEYRKLAGLPDGAGGMPSIGPRDLSQVGPLPAAPEPGGVVVAVPTFESQPVGMPPPALHVPPPPPIGGDAPPPPAVIAPTAKQAFEAAATSLAAARFAAAGATLPPIPAAPPPVPLGPEPARRSRPRPQELIAAATGAMQTTTTAVEDTVDVASVLRRARTLVSAADLDAELAALGGPGGPDATPAPISADEASSQLANLLGVAVRRTGTARGERAASERAFTERAAEADRAAERAAAERARADQVAAERAVATRLAAEQAAAERTAEAGRAVARAEADRAAIARAEAARAEAERTALARAEAERAEKAESDRADAERAESREAERLAAEREAQRIAADRDAAKRLVAERAASMRLAAERAEAEHTAAAARETERSAAARESERNASAREAERVAAVRAEAERADAARGGYDHGYRPSSAPILDDEDDESTAAQAEPPLPPELEPVAPDAAVTLPAARRPATPVPDDDPGADLASSLGATGAPITAVGIVPEPVAPAFVPDSFEDDPDTRYGAEIPGHAKRWMPRLESDIEFAIDSALTEVPDDDVDPTPPVRLATPPPREGTLDAGFEILDEADVADAAAAEAAAEAAAIEAAAAAAAPTAAPPSVLDMSESDVMAIPSAIPSESAYRPSSHEDFEDEDDRPIHPMPTRPSSRPPARPPSRPTGGAYSISRARSDDGTLDYHARGDGLDDAGPDVPDTLEPEEAPLTLPPDEPVRPEPRVPQDFRTFDQRYDATPEPIDDFADRLDLESRSVSLSGLESRPEYRDLIRSPGDESDLYINADDLRAGARDAEDMYGARPRAGSAAPETDDDLGALADPPFPASFPDFDGEEASAPYMEEAPPSAEDVYESGRHARFPTPGDWDRSDVHDAAPEAPVAARPNLAPMPVVADEIDLDSALEDLDVDLGGDDHPAPPPPPPLAKRSSRPPTRRAVTDDGIPIDFDDDDED